MFIYLSFLRPPPLNGPLSRSISITPQVSNDLRTEPFGEAQDIYYSWSQETTAVSKTDAPQIPKPVKLTTWRQANAYKELSVPFPIGIREGQAWRLILTSHAQSQSHIINLKGTQLGKTGPLPVMSMPLFCSSGHPKLSAATKQEHIERIYRLPLRSDENAFIVVREQTSFDLDKKVWDSGIGLSSWILDMYDENGASEDLAEVKLALFAPKRTNVLELGAGTGIVALTLGALRSAVDPADSGVVIATDLPSAMPLLEHNISANSHLFSSSPIASVLDWDYIDLPEEIQSVQDGFNAVVMADVTYNTSSFPSLVRTLSSVIQLNARKNTKPPLILLGYKERDPAERTLWDMILNIGIVFRKVGSRSGSGGQEVEVWVGQVEDDAWQETSKKHASL